MFRERIAVDCKNQTKHINIHCVGNAVLLNVIAGDIYSYLCALKRVSNYKSHYSHFDIHKLRICSDNKLSASNFSFKQHYPTYFKINGNYFES
jgi:hypothetical protein